MMTPAPSETPDALEAPVAAPPSKQRKNRASNPDKVLAMIASRTNDREYTRKVRLAKLVEDAFDRIPPDSEDDLTADGLSWCANVDWGGMAAGINDKVEQIYNLFTQPETYVRLTPGLTERGRILEPMRILERLDKEMLDDWSEFLPELEMMVHNCCSLGLGIFHFHKPNSWHFKSLHPCNLILPKKAKLNPETWAWCALKTEFQITDLLDRLADKTVSTAVGWKTDAIEKTIEEFATNGGKEAIASINADPEAYITGDHGEDLWFSQENGVTIDGWIFYVREWNGTVSEHHIVNREGIGFIYSGIGRHKRMADILALFPLSLGQGHIDRIRGYGMMMLPFHDLENQTMNHAVDVTMLSSGFIFKAGAGDDYKTLRESVHVNGPFMTFPDGVELSQQSFGNPTAGLLGLRREFERMANFRNRSFGGSEYGQRTPEESATGARLRWQDSQTSRTFEVARTYQQIGNFHRIRVKRYLSGSMTEADPGGAEVKAMIKEAAMEGVTPDDVANIRRITARTIFGDGDPNNQFLALQDIKEHFGRLPPTGQRVYMRMLFIARLRDVDLTNELMGPDNGGMDRELAFQQWHARIENDVFEGSDTRVDPMESDNHFIHVGEHTIYAEEVKARAESGELPEDEAFKRLMRADAHSRPHLMSVMADPMAQEEAKNFFRRWADLRNYTAKLGQHLEAKREKEQKEQMENMRNPQPNVKDRETVLTEQVKRAAILNEQRMKAEHEVELHELRKRLMQGAELTKQQSAMLNNLDTLP